MRAHAASANPLCSKLLRWRAKCDLAAERTLARPARTAAPTGRAGPPLRTGASASILGQRLRAAGGHKLWHARLKRYRDAHAPLRAAARCLQLPCPAAQPRATCCGNRLLLAWIPLNRNSTLCMTASTSSLFLTAYYRCTFTQAPTLSNVTTWQDRSLAL